MSLFKWLFGYKKIQNQSVRRKIISARSVTYEKGKYEDDLGYDSFVIYHKVLKRRIKERVIKNVIKWDSHYFNLVELKPKTMDAVVKIIKKGIGREPFYKSNIVKLTKNKKIRRRIKSFSSD